MVLSNLGLNMSYFNLKITVIFVNFRKGFHKMAERKYLQVFPDYYPYIFLKYKKQIKSFEICRFLMVNIRESYILKQIYDSIL